jgi:hypothetical protein
VIAKPRTMSEHQASRTLLKSPPELWAECSDPQSLARHLDAFFGEIRITRLEPERAVAWEGERVSGTVRLEPSGWGTKVTLTANAPEAASDPLPEPVRREAIRAEPSNPEPVAHEPLPVSHQPVPVAHEPGPVAHQPVPVAHQPVPAPPPFPRPVEPEPVSAESAEPPPEVAPKPVRMGFLGRIRYLLSAPPQPERLVPEPVLVVTTPAAGSPAPMTSAARAANAGTHPAEPTVLAEPVSPPPPDPAHAPAPVGGAEVALSAALESLGKAHHRPFSRG